MATSRARGVFIALAVLLAAASVAAAPEDDFRAGEQAYLAGDVTGAMGALRRAADAGHAPAQALLAEILDRAEFNDEALAWYRRAAEQGLAAGEFGLGTMYLAGEGVRADRSQALFWFARAAGKDHAEAIVALAQALMAPPPGAAPDPEARVLRWVERAAALQYVPAMERLAAAYASGALGLAPDAAQAKRWAELAAEAKKHQAGTGAKKRRS